MRDGSTPNIDKLQSIGTTFRYAFTGKPNSVAARPTIATGLRSRGHGVLTNGYALSPEIPTFMQTLQAARYRTGAFGRGHFLFCEDPDEHHNLCRDDSFATERMMRRDLLLEDVILQDYPQPPRDLYAPGVQ